MNLTQHKTKSFLLTASIMVVVFYLSETLALESTPAQEPTRWVNEPSANALKHTRGLVHETFESKSMSTMVGYSVVLPPSYEKSGERYPVVYWLHGGGGNECSSLHTAKSWEKLYESNEVREVILVYPNGFRSGYMDHADGKTMVESVIIKELIPLVDKKYRTIASRSGRSAHGFSMGASGSLKFAIKYPEMFCSAVAYGGGAIDLETTKMKFVLDILKRNLGDNPELIRLNNTYHFLGKNEESIRENEIEFLLICGADDSWNESAITFQAALKEKRIPCQLTIVPSVGHNIGGLMKVEGAAAARFQDEVFAKELK